MRDDGARPIRAIVFDYGNTLMEFSKTQGAICDEALIDGLQRLYGRVELERYV